MAAARFKKIVTFASPLAGKGTPREGLWKRAVHLLGPRNKKTFATTTLEELATAVSIMRIERPDIAVIMGGDGSIRRVIGALLESHARHPMEHFPTIVVASLGTVNVLASELGLRDIGAEEVVRRIAARVHEGKPLKTVRIRPLLVNGQVCFLYGAGTPAQIMEAYNVSPTRGIPGAVRVVFGAAAKEAYHSVTFRESPEVVTRRFHASVKYPGHPLPGAAGETHSVILAGTITAGGLGVPLLPRAREKEGAFMMRTADLGFWQYIRRMPLIASGLPVPGIRDVLTNKAVVTFAQPTTVTLDGDLIHNCDTHVLEPGPELDFVVLEDDAMWL